MYIAANNEDSLRLNPHIVYDTYTYDIISTQPPTGFMEVSQNRLTCEALTTQ